MNRLLPKVAFALGALVLSLAALFTGYPCKATQPGAELKPLQGYWEGEGPGGKCSITITNNSLYYYGRTDFWFKTTFTLPAGTDPQQLHATIKETPAGDSIGKVVFAIFKIEDGTLTLETVAEDDLSDKRPKTFANAANRYVLKQAQPHKQNIEASGKGSTRKAEEIEFFPISK